MKKKTKELSGEDKELEVKAQTGKKWNPKTQGNAVKRAKSKKRF
jgi:hypothetical protein